MRDPAAVEAYRRDPLVHHGRMTLRSVAQVVASAQTLPRRLGALSMPLLTLHGGADRLAAPAGSSTIHRHIASADRTEHVYPGVLHDVLRDLPRARLRVDLISWIDERI